ncbi:hypothetical protein HDU76_007411 [Blyttiomyces sp. JEL0837]|nr:hypothetical protein HDU76_007411 [Blyttiomyces sp. JEL0837]
MVHREFGLFPFRFWRPVFPILERTIPEGQLKDPWARRELWRSHPFWSARNRVMLMFPGIGIGATAFAAYLSYEAWYENEGPGKAEKEYWAKWMEEREKRLHKESGHHGHH